MILADVNLWVYAFRPDSPYHKVARERLEAHQQAQAPFLFVPSVAASFLRLVTNPKIFLNPSDPAEAWEFLTVLQDDPLARLTEADAMTFGLFKHLSLVAGSMGTQVPDAFLAALAVQHEATFLTVDQGFQRYQALKVELLSPLS